MKQLFAFLSTAVLATGLVSAQNLLSNGDLNLPTTTASPDVWQVWSYGGGWANRQLDSSAFDGSYYMAVGGGNAWSSGGGFYQTVSASAGLTYDLTVESAVQNWWWPSGEIRMFFFDASNIQLANPTVSVTTGISSYDTGLPWASYELTAVAPDNTAFVKVEFASQSGMGTVFFDNAVLTAVPEPSSMALLAVGSLGMLGWCRLFRRG